jgi:hypothetical protein
MAATAGQDSPLILLVAQGYVRFARRSVNVGLIMLGPLLTFTPLEYKFSFFNGILFSIPALRLAIRPILCTEGNASAGGRRPKMHSIITAYWG